MGETKDEGPAPDGTAGEGASDPADDGSAAASSGGAPELDDAGTTIGDDAGTTIGGDAGSSIGDDADTTIGGDGTGLPDGRPRRILVATRSVHKLEEIRRILGGVSVELLSLADAGIERRAEEERIEVHDSFAENAVAKARYFRKRSGLPTVADDSGLCVDALDGRPGVRTKRFAPPSIVERYGRDAANNHYLVQRLVDVPEDERGAHYHCSVAVETDDTSFVLEGTVHGRIADDPRGDGGFGYDPLFVVPDRGRTFGELPASSKEHISHRAEAFGKLRAWLTGEHEVP